MQEYQVKVYKDGNKVWYVNSQLHRTDGPAIEHADGYKAWYINDQLHRTDGPAIEWASGYKTWYIEGVVHTETEFNQKTASICTNTVIIDGVEYQLVKK